MKLISLIILLLFAGANTNAQKIVEKEIFRTDSASSFMFSGMMTVDSCFLFQYDYSLENDSNRISYTQTFTINKTLDSISVNKEERHQNFLTSVMYPLSNGKILIIGEEWNDTIFNRVSMFFVDKTGKKLRYSSFNELKSVYGVPTEDGGIVITAIQHKKGFEIDWEKHKPKIVKIYKNGVINMQYTDPILSDDLIIMKIDSLGNTSWKSRYGEVQGIDRGFILKKPDGFLLIHPHYLSDEELKDPSITSVSHSGPPFVLKLTKMDFNGNLVEEKTFKEAAGFFFDFGRKGFCLMDGYAEEDSVFELPQHNRPFKGWTRFAYIINFYDENAKLKCKFRFPLIDSAPELQKNTIDSISFVVSTSLPNGLSQVFRYNLDGEVIGTKVFNDKQIGNRIIFKKRSGSYILFYTEKPIKGSGVCLKYLEFSFD